MRYRALAALALFLAPGPSLADSLAQQGNQFLAIQFLDCVTTHEDLKLPNTVELDPLARPFTHSVAQNMIPAVVINVALRLLWHRKPKMFHYADVIEGTAVINNAALFIRIKKAENNVQTTNAGTRAQQTR